MSRRPSRTVEKVLDGDTIKVKKSINGTRYIRIPKVDTPEKGERGYSQAKQFTNKLLRDKKITLDPIKKDKYGRLVANVFQKGRSVSKILKKKGY